LHHWLKRRSTREERKPVTREIIITIIIIIIIIIIPSSPQHPDRILDPPSPISNGYQDSFLMAKAAGIRS
jgi:hypothetical protein